MGVVYKAKRIRDDKLFAIKEINMKRLQAHALKEVKEEVALLQALRWPTVLFLVDHWSNNTDKLTYLVMPLLDGGNLQERTEAAIDSSGDLQVRVRQVVEWYAQAIHGLTYLHSCGIIHRDLKPENLVLATEGRALRIGDLGSAQRLLGPG